MKETVNERVIKLITHFEYSDKEFCERTKIARNTLVSIKNGGIISDRTLRVISETLNANKRYLTHGEEPMLEIDHLVLDDAKKEHISYILKNWPVLQKTVEMLEEQLKKKDEQISQLMAMLGKVNFLKPLTKKDSAKILKLFPELLEATGS